MTHGLKYPKFPISYTEYLNEMQQVLSNIFRDLLNPRMEETFLPDIGKERSVFEGYIKGQDLSMWQLEMWTLPSFSV